MRFRYRPKDNRTPVNDPVLGHLSYDGVYDDPRCENDPRFQPIKEDADKDKAPADEQADAKTAKGKS